VPITVTLPSNQPPIPDAGGPYDAVRGVPEPLDASESLDPDATPLAYRWDIDDDGVWDIAWTDDPIVYYSFPETGTHLVRLEVADGQNIRSATTTATVQARVYLPLVLRNH